MQQPTQSLQQPTNAAAAGRTPDVIRRQILQSFDPGQHGREAKKRIWAAAEALVGFVGEDGRIPDHQLREAADRARIATGCCWCTARCRNLARLMRITSGSRNGSN